MKHLLYEHQNSVSELKTEGVVITKVMQEEYSGLESELQKEMKSLKMNLRDQELSKQSLIKSIKLVCRPRFLLTFLVAFKYVLTINLQW